MDGGDMETIMLGGSDLEVSRLAFGGCPMGGHGWGDVSRTALVQAVKASLDCGLNFFDTADTYGLGEGESVLGEALRGRRDQAVIATKFGVRVGAEGTHYDNSPAWIRTALEGSLRRLRTDYVDLYQIHYRDGRTPLADVVEALVDLREQGKIRCLGLSNVGQRDLDDIGVVVTDFVSFQNEFSLATRDHEEDITLLMTKFGLSPLTWGSLGQGILTGKYDASARFGPDDRRSRPVYVNFHGEKLERNLRIVAALRTVAAEVEKSVPAVALRWILDQLPGSVAIVGIKNRLQLDSNLEVIDWTLPADARELLDDVSRTEYATS